MVNLEMRLWTVGYGVLKGAASECGDTVRPSLGFVALNRDRINPKVRTLFTEVMNLDSQLRVMAVYKGGAAERAGLKKGDVLADATGPALTPISDGKQESRQAARQRLPQGQALTVDVLRDGEALHLAMTPDLVCDYPLSVSPGSEVNAYADGSKIVISKGMMRFATEDRELAMVVGHELGHNTMGHLSKKKTNMLLGTLADALAAAYHVNTQSAFANAGAQAYSQDFEAEADYVGMYYLARAGYDIEGAADFWRRMAAENPGSIKSSHATTHPATPERFLALEKVNAEVAAKESAHAELVPNRTK